MSRRSIEENNQRRDVEIPRRDVPERTKNDIATLGSNVAMFQRRYNSTSRHCNPTSRRSREAQNQRRDVESQRRDVPEKG